MGVLPSGERALKLSMQAFFLSLFMIFFLPWQFRTGGSIGSQILTEISIFIVTTGVSLCLEINHHFVQVCSLCSKSSAFGAWLTWLFWYVTNSLSNKFQVVHTRRCSFAPPQSTAAADTNPTEFILESLEQSDPRSLIQYLAYQDLCVASECNLEPWRRAAFFEESGETYKRIVTTCLKPLEEFTSKIAESLEDFSSDKPELMLQQSKLFSAFDDFQVKLHYVYNYLCCCIFSCELSTVIFVCICSPL